MKKLLIIGYVWPEPRSSAAGAHVMALIRHFQNQQWQITFASPAALSEHMVDLEALGIEIKEIQLNDSSFDHYIAELQPEMVMFDRFMMEEQFGWRVEKACPNALRLLDTEDLHFLRNARHQASKQHRQPSKAELYSEQAQREIAAILRCDLTLIVSEHEMALLQQQFNVTPTLLLYSPFMVEEVPSVDQVPDFEDRQHFVSIGNFRHAPNWDAVLWLKESIWPLIRKQLPKAELHIYGAYPPPKATALHNPKQGFHVMGWAEDALQVIKQARVLVAPLRFGAGLKGKFIDAMLSGTPSATTSIGVEGMAGELSWCGVVADDAETFATAAVQLYQDQTQWQQSQQNGFEIVQQRFSDAEHSRVLIETIEKCQASLEEHRLNNFTGAMLRHHNHRSTQFMSQWIEVKNRLKLIEEQRNKS